MDKFKVFTVVLGLLFVLSVFSYIGLSDEADAIYNDYIELNERIADYDSCMADAYDVYSDSWDSRCATNSMNPNCELVLLERYDINEAYLDDIIECGERD